MAATAAARLRRHDRWPAAGGGVAAYRAERDGAQNVVTSGSAVARAALGLSVGRVDGGGGGSARLRRLVPTYITCACVEKQPSGPKCRTC